MSLVWQCDRCKAISNNGRIADPPDAWVTRSMPVCGSEGARSSMDTTLCGDCDDRLYGWLWEDSDHAAPASWTRLGLTQAQWEDSDHE